MKQLALAMRLRERALFDSFVAGPNERVVGQLRLLAGEGGIHVGQGGMLARVAWLSGPGGVGKTHLLQASCSLAIAMGRSALYLPLSQLRAFGPEALEGWQSADLLALDELAEVIGQRDWEQALFALYRDAEQRAATLLLAARQPPAQLPFVLADLRSRLSAALPFEVQALEEADQRRVLRLRAHARGLLLPEQTARYLQRRFPRELSTLCTLLDTIDLAALQAQRRLTVPFIRAVLAAQLPPVRARRAK